MKHTCTRAAKITGMLELTRRMECSFLKVQPEKRKKQVLHSKTASFTSEQRFNHIARQCTRYRPPERRKTKAPQNCKTFLGRRVSDAHHTTPNLKPNTCVAREKKRIWNSSTALA
ncbi:unnamed protein product [Ixodes pacificus]